MKLETERLYIVPCTEESIHVANEQGYNSGPHIVGHVENVKQNKDLLPWGAWYVIRKEDDIVLGDIGFKGKPNEGSIRVLEKLHMKRIGTTETMINWRMEK